jgi:hypothetical protein
MENRIQIKLELAHDFVQESTFSIIACLFPAVVFQYIRVQTGKETKPNTK